MTEVGREHVVVAGTGRRGRRAVFGGAGCGAVVFLQPWKSCGLTIFLEKSNSSPVLRACQRQSGK